MHLKTEEITIARKILFVFKKRDSIISQLEKIVISYNFDIFASSSMPTTTRQFSSIFVFDDIETINKLISTHQYTDTKILFILYNRKKDVERYRKILSTIDRKNMKVVNIDAEAVDSNTIDRLLWFLFSKSTEQVLDLERTLKVKKKPLKNTYHFSFYMSKRRTLFFAFIVFFCFEFFFLLPFTTSSFFIVKSAHSLASGDIEATQKNLNRAKPFLSLTNTSYNLARPIFSFFYLALTFDDLILLENKSYSLINKGIKTTENSKRILPLMLNRGKTPLEQQQLVNRISLLKQEVSDISDISDLIADKLAHYQFKPVERIARQFSAAKTILDRVQKFLPHIDTLIGGTSGKKYLVLFENNMELRPGGGFIGSYGIITFQNYTLKDITIHDVYDADGQLKAHIEPPFALKTYMNQPHWFLRDSNFSPDFEKNFNLATFFLDKELGLKNFSGGAAITTTAIASLIDAFGDVYLPDYNETITKDNFYIKTQLNVESQFFPGSKQKKNFLSELVAILMTKLESVPPQKIGLTLKQSLDEKQIVMYVVDKNIQKDFDTMGYGGKLAVSKCPSPDTQSQHCIADSVFPLDANIGINKANFFVKRFVTLSISTDTEGTITNVLKTALRNESSSSIFPGGLYKNYYQVYIPKNTTVTNVLIDGVTSTTYEESVDNEPFKTIGVLVEVPPKKTREVTIEYTLADTLKSGNTLYQLIVQKQIGASNSDFVLQLTLPKNIHLVSQNFSGLAKTTGLVYNTTLSNDRIFLIQLTKE